MEVPFKGVGRASWISFVLNGIGGGAFLFPFPMVSCSLAFQADRRSLNIGDAVPALEEGAEGAGRDRGAAKVKGFAAVVLIGGALRAGAAAMGREEGGFEVCESR